MSRTSTNLESQSASISELEVQPELTILMPCLNEARTLGFCIKEANEWAAKSGVRTEVVIGDNGSTDGSQEIARGLGARVIDVPVRGYGAALFHGAKAARGKYLIMGDSDASYVFGDLDKFVERLRTGDDLVMGNRFIGGIMPGAMPWKNRYIGNPTITMIGRIFFKSPCGDFYCGLRGFSKSAFERMDLRSTGMEFALEMVTKANLYGMRISEVPTILRKDGRDRPPHLRPWRDGWRSLRFFLLYSPRWLFLLPGFLLAMVFGLISAVLWWTPVRVGAVSFDVHSLLFTGAAMLIGVQMVAFAVFTKVFAIEEGLLPRDPGFEGLFKYFKLEGGLIVGASLLIAGLASGVVATMHWSHLGFGVITDQRVSLRWAILGAFLLVLGFQIMLGSFFLSVLGLRLRRQ